MNPKKQYDLVYNKQGDLKDELKDLFKQFKQEDLIPEFDSNLFRFDWKIIGKEYEDFFGYRKLKNKEMYPKPLEIMDFKQWEESLSKVRQWVWWLSYKLFYPHKIIYSSRITDSVLIRVAVSQLNDLSIPKELQDIFFYNMTTCYYSRKKIYLEYYYRYILGLPF